MDKTELTQEEIEKFTDIVMESLTKAQSDGIKMGAVMVASIVVDMHEKHNDIEKIYNFAKEIIEKNGSNKDSI